MENGCRSQNGQKPAQDYVQQSVGREGLEEFQGGC